MRSCVSLIILSSCATSAASEPSAWAASWSTCVDDCLYFLVFCAYSLRCLGQSAGFLVYARSEQRLCVPSCPKSHWGYVWLSAGIVGGGEEVRIHVGWRETGEMRTAVEDKEQYKAWPG
ncbi:hypothetical protein C8Q76DRAFT_726582 [Earliella scabrosa]|nr:hypothetical protein C8Q76DRAFT_726582 [Earliella scabrosa]